MYKNQLIIILNILFCLVLSEETQSLTETPHISLVVHEDLLNDFFKNIGEIKGEGTGSSIDYTWYLLNPRIEIKSNDAVFKAKVRAKTDNFRVTRDVNGNVDITYNKETNQIEVKIDKAKVKLDVEIFGKKFVLTELDIAKYFTKSMKIDGPQSVNNTIEYQLPDGKTKEMIVNTKAYNLVLVENEIHLITTLEFNLKE